MDASSNLSLILGEISKNALGHWIPKNYGSFKSMNLPWIYLLLSGARVSYQDLPHAYHLSLILPHISITLVIDQCGALGMSKWARCALIVLRQSGRLNIYLEQNLKCILSFTCKGKLLQILSSD